ncbi:hypothetical protein RDWZM_010038 [Blomia tropicalis]|uniref:Nuclear protein 1 n=1 Tax=Blomia tropicalis TaxID=40697 RepID=A0A9Q0LW15_BLOTA|nr:hypothetical protein RDWZM_010038 [Blomia tropicalis]
MENKSTDQYDYYTFDHDKHMFSGRSGKQRSKRESAVHTNRFDPNGHSRKISTKIRNTERNRTSSNSSKTVNKAQESVIPITVY